MLLLLGLEVAAVVSTIFPCEVVTVEGDSGAAAAAAAAAAFLRFFGGMARRLMTRHSRDWVNKDTRPKW